MRFGQFFTEVCGALRDQFNWVGVETIVTEKTQCLDVIHNEYSLALHDIQQSSAKEAGSELVKQRIYSTALKIHQLKTDQFMMGLS